MMQIPYLDLSYTNLDHKLSLQSALNRVLDSGWTILGNELSSFEQKWAEYIGVKYAIGVGNGLDAMIIALKVLGVGKGDEVIVPSNTYIATWMAITSVGATIVAVEPEFNTFNIDASKIEAVISSKTKAILPVHLFGRPCNMEAIMSIAEKYNLYVVEDNAQAQGASVGNKKTASFGHINATSFYPGKNLGALGDAGIITTDNEEWCEMCRQYRNYGSSKKYVNEIIGLNSRLDELQAAFLTEKLPHLDSWNEMRRLIAKKYIQQLSIIQSQIQVPELDDSSGNVWHIFPIITERRDELASFLNSHGVGTLIHYPIANHLQKAYSGISYLKNDLPIAEELARIELSLPIYPGLSDKDINYISELIIGFFK